jgi:hypothetical protein
MDSRTRRKLRSLKYADPRHRKTRKEWAPLVAAGLVNCARCGDRIEPGTKWDLGHDDQMPQYHSGPEHSKCNRGAPHQNVTSRVW